MHRSAARVRRVAPKYVAASQPQVSVANALVLEQLRSVVGVSVVGVRSRVLDILNASVVLIILNRRRQGECRRSTWRVSAVVSPSGFVTDSAPA